MADAAQLASLADETPEGRSIVVLAKERFDIRERELDGEHTFVPVLGDHPDVGSRRRRPPDPQGRGRVGEALGRRAGRDQSRPSSTGVVERDLPGRLDPARGGRRARASSASSS